MPSEKQILETLERIEDDMSGFIAASLVDLESGMTLAAKSARDDFDLTAASAYNSELIKQKLKIMKTLGLPNTLEDIVITLGDQIHMIRMIGTTMFLYLAADRGLTNLAIIRAAVMRHAPDLG